MTGARTVLRGLGRSTMRGYLDLWLHRWPAVGLADSGQENSMLALIKALIPGALLSWVVATVIGSNGSTGGVMYIGRLMIAHHEVYWSWPLFIAATALAWFILLMLE